MRPLAINIATESLFAVPKEIKNKEELAGRLCAILKIDKKFLQERLSRNKSFIWLVRKITSLQADQIRSLHIKELGLIKENKRAYPNGYLLSHAIGFVNIDNQGLEGIELTFDKYLRGSPGWAMFLRDARQNRLNLWEQMFPSKDGYDIVLTVDEVIQYIAERELDKVFRESHARGASIIVLNPRTGEILAIANRPTFDLNYFSKVSQDTKRNRAISDLFEPGSVFKIVTASAAIEENRVNEEDKFFCENGEYRVANHILHDHRPHGWLSFQEVIEQSSNIGTTKVAQVLGPDIVYRYARLFGFGDDSRVDLPGEIKGMLKETRAWSKTSIGAVPIGQEVGTTVLQLVSAVSTIANGGNLTRPFIVKRVQDKQGTVIKENTPVVVRRVITQDTAFRMQRILQGVIENGTGKLAKMADFSAGGKTGTAQKLEPNGAYSHSKFVASFIGFAPAKNPVIAIAVVIDEPHPYYFGGVVAAPVFKNVAADTLKYLGVKPLENDRIAQAQ